jgi:predicted DNA binding CopG/RHH family protein
MEKPMSKQSIPHTDSIQEMSAFWDTHDLTDFEDQLHEITEPVFERKNTVQIHLPTRDLEALRQAAQLRGVSDVELIQEWILERLRTA